MDVRISDLPRVEPNGEEASLPVVVRGASGRITLSTIADEVKRAMGYLEKPLVKCRHCGQWGAVYCACAHCGAPIDPPKVTA